MAALKASIRSLGNVQTHLIYSGTIIITVFLINIEVLGQKVVGNHLTLDMQKASGYFGPRGSLSNSILPLSQADLLQSNRFPKPTHKPTGLKNIFEYFYVYNREQFIFQSFTSGKLSKQDLLIEAQKINMDLKDTINLSRKPIRTGIYVIKGEDESGRPVFYIDSNNDGDFADELPYVLPSSGGYQQAKSSSIKVVIDFYTKGQTSSEEVLCFISQNPMFKENINFAITQFKYAKFAVRDRRYLICIESSYANPQKIYVLPDSLLFEAADSKSTIEINQSLGLKNCDVRLTSIGGNANSVVLTGQGVIALKILSAQDNLNGGITSKPVARSVGFFAPNLSGKDVGSTMEKVVSLQALKGKYVFVDIWSTFCIPCIEDFPKLKEVYDYFGRDKFEIIGIVDERSLGLAKKIVRDKNLPWANLLMNQKGNDLKAYTNVYEYPTTYLVDPTGKIIESGLNASSLLSKLSTLLNKR